MDVTGTITGDTSLTLDSITITTAEIGVLDGVTPGTATASKALVVDTNKDIATIRNLTIDGVFTDGNYTFDTNGNVSGLGTVGCGAITSSGNLEVTGTITGDTSLTLDSITITTAEIGVLDGVTPGTATASKALVVDANKDIATIRNLTIDGVFTDGNYTFDTNGNVSGLGTVGCGAITSSGNLEVTGTITGDTSLTLDSITITTAEIGVLDGVTPGTATASKALVVDANKDIATIRNLTIDGVFTDGNYTFDTNGNVSGLGTVGCGAITSSGNLEVTGTITGDTSLTLDSITITTAEIGVLDGVTPGTAAASKALVVDANKDIATIRNLTIDGEFTDGNYTFDTNGNVSGLGTVGCGAITSSGNLEVTGTITGDTSLTLDSITITTAEIGVLDGVTPGTATESKALVVDASKNVSDLGTVGCGAITSSGNLDVTGTITGDTSLTLDSTTITTAEIGVLDGVTPGTVTGSKALVVDTNKDIGTIRNLTIDGTFSDGNYTFDTNGNVSGLGTVGCGAITSSGNLEVTGTITGDTSLTLDSTTITTAEIGVLDGVTPGTAAGSKALVVDASKNVSGLGTVGCGAITSSGNLDVTGTITGDTSLTLDSTTITTAEIGVLDGVTPGTAAGSKALVVDASKNVSGLGTVGCGAITSSGNLDVTGTITGDTSLTLDSTTITTAEIGVLDGVTPGTAAGSKALVVDTNKDIGTIRNLTIDGTLSVDQTVTLNNNVKLSSNISTGNPSTSSSDFVLYLDGSSNIKRAALTDVCFLKGTKITLSDRTQKNIEDLTLEDIVLTYNIKYLSKITDKIMIPKWSSESLVGRFSESSIRNIWINPTDSYLVINNKLKVTKQHIIFFKRDNKFYFNFAEKNYY